MKISLYHSGIGHPSSATRRFAGGFTMIEIAICLAIIGVALVGIIGVLPYGMNTQRANREETVIGQDANVLMEIIRNGSHGADDLTNYVYAIVNTGSSPVGYLNPLLAPKMGFSIASYPGISKWYNVLSNGDKIIGLLSQPEYVDLNYNPIPSVMFGGISNHVVAYVRSISGLATEKPPQDNDIMTADAFTYRIYCVNAPEDIDTNLFYAYGPNSVWQPGPYKANDYVFSTTNFSYWRATIDTNSVDFPSSPVWQKIPSYPLELATRQHDIRLTFLWPQLPNGNLGVGRQTFRTTVSGQVLHQYNGLLDLYYYQPQTFSSTP